MGESALERQNAYTVEQLMDNLKMGVIFLDVISNLERISDHAYNLAGYIKDEL